MFAFFNLFARHRIKRTYSIVLWELCYNKILLLLQEKVFTENSLYILKLATLLALIDEAIDIKSISDPNRDLLDTRTITLLDTMRSIVDDVLPHSGEEEENEEDFEGE